MSLRTRQRFITGITIGVILWPLAHLTLVAGARVDPWELFGWAMYSQPAPRVSVRVDVVRRGEVQPLRAMGALRKEVRAWARRRSTLGRLATPEPLVEHVFGSDVTIEAVEITVRRLELDRASARLVQHDERLRFPRGASRGRPLAP